MVNYDDFNQIHTYFINSQIQIQKDENNATFLCVMHSDLEFVSRVLWQRFGLGLQLFSKGHFSYYCYS